VKNFFFGVFPASSFFWVTKFICDTFWHQSKQIYFTLITQ